MNDKEKTPGVWVLTVAQLGTKVYCTDLRLPSLAGVVTCLC